MSRFILPILLILSTLPQRGTAWGFYAHRQINRLAVFTLPPEMMPFFKKHLQTLSENAVNPDKRRYAVVGEAARHYIDLEAYGDSVWAKPYWADAVAFYTEDTLLAHGIVPWHIQLVKHQLTEAFKEKNVRKILRLSADLGHYLADAHVPLHTTRNYNGQLTGQEGLHAFWESRLPELYAGEYDYFVGPAAYVESPQRRAWDAVRNAHACLDSVFLFEKQLTAELGEGRKYAPEERNGVIQKTYSREFSKRYHELLNRQVERQMRAAIRAIGDFWYTCWVDAGQPDLNALALVDPSDQDKKEDEQERQSWIRRLLGIRPEGDD